MRTLLLILLVGGAWWWFSGEKQNNELLDTDAVVTASVTATHQLAESEKKLFQPDSPSENLLNPLAAQLVSTVAAEPEMSCHERIAAQYRSFCQAGPVDALQSCLREARDALLSKRDYQC